MEFKQIEIKKLAAATYNPRKDLNPEDAEYQKIKNSILEFGYIEPLIVNKDYTIIGGHQRYKVLLDLGYTKIECIVLDVDKVKEKAINIALNKIIGEWDNSKLEQLLLELKEEEFDLSLTGFNFDEVEKMLNQALGIKEDDFDLEKALEDIEEPTTKYGEIYQLGKHRLMCGDSIKQEDVRKLINEQNIDMLLTDPPYDMQMGGKGCFAEATKNIKKRINDIINFDVTVLSYLPKLEIKNCFIFTSKNGIKDYLKMFEEYNYDIHVWCKTNPIPFTHGSFLPDLEYLLYFNKQGRVWNNSLKPTDTYKRYYISQKLEGREGAGDLHPTMKPVELLSNKIRICSKENGIVLDLFRRKRDNNYCCRTIKPKMLHDGIRTKIL